MPETASISTIGHQIAFSIHSDHKTYTFGTTTVRLIAEEILLQQILIKAIAISTERIIGSGYLEKLALIDLRNTDVPELKVSPDSRLG